ncbi:unnamed protein product [Rhizopus stolonifer]
MLMRVDITFYGKAAKISQAIALTSDMYVKLDDHYQIQDDKYDELAADLCPKVVAGYTGKYQWRSILLTVSWITRMDGQPTGISSLKLLMLITPSCPMITLKSLEAKVEYVNKQGLAGFMVWSLEMDDTKHTFLKTIQDTRK